MNTHKARKLIMALGLVALVAAGGWSVQARMHGPMMGGGERPMDREAMMERCQQMMQHRQQMHEHMQQMDEQLEQQVQAMDQAQGEAKVDAMADVVHTLIEQRRQMHEHHRQMMPRMMQHMGQHMMMDADDDERHEMMMQCPMMQPEKPEQPEAEPAEPDHEAHH